MAYDNPAGFGLYVHWPFCLAKCPYCDFNSHVAREVDQEAFRGALLKELAHMDRLGEPPPLDSIFFGGGTPSLMPVETVAAVIDRATELWGASSGLEVTLEANPTSVEADRFAGYRATGVNRVSLGVQALNDQDLKFLGRQHSVAEAMAALDVARSTFDRVSFDLIYARTGQTVDGWRRELGQALNLGPDHLSLYQLTLEEGTPFRDLYDAGKLTVPGQDDAAALYEVTQELCERAGLPAYEISNHAAPGAQSRHNLIYWRYGRYAGIGPGAHGRLLVDGSLTATLTEKSPEAWLRSVGEAGHGLTVQEPVPQADQASEFLLMGLRLTEGISQSRYRDLSGRGLDAAAKDGLIDQGLLQEEGDRLAATAKGRLVLNHVIASLH